LRASIGELADRRGTLYAGVSRHDLDSLLRLFDFPDPNVTSDQRTTTTVPFATTVFFFNSEFMVRQAKALVVGWPRGPEIRADRIRHAFLFVYGRSAGKTELQIGLGSWVRPSPARRSGQQRDRRYWSKWEQYAKALLSANEFMYAD